jgi:hypothetical protein
MEIELVCQCTNRDEYESCLSFLKQKGICWVNAQEIELEQNLNRYDDFCEACGRTVNAYIFLETHSSFGNPPYNKQLEIAYAFNDNTNSNIYATLPKGFSKLKGNKFYVASLKEFFDILDFNLKDVSKLRPKLISLWQYHTKNNTNNAMSRINLKKMHKNLKKKTY